VNALFLSRNTSLERPTILSEKFSTVLLEQPSSDNQAEYQHRGKTKTKMKNKILKGLFH
jgi:hypothetical protein